MKILGMVLVVGALASMVAAPAFPQSLPGFLRQQDRQAEPEGWTRTLASGGGCVAGGGVGAAIGRWGGRLLRQAGELSAEEAELATYLGAGLGCVVGGAAARGIVRNMTESAREEQEEAWMRAQAQADTEVEWDDPNSDYSGTTVLIDTQTLDDGRECGTRHNIIQASAGQADQYQLVCRNESGVYVDAEA